LIVIDASAEVAALLNVGPGLQAIRDRIARPGETLHVPHLFEIEVLHALRRFSLRGTVSPERLRLALSRLRDTQLARYPHTPLMGRIWELKENLTAYDAAYVALAEALDVPWSRWMRDWSRLPASAPRSRSTGRRRGSPREPQTVPWPPL
jgi:predicted nucleic acid-binding protein